MKYLKSQFTTDYYRVWELGLLLSVPKNSSLYTVKFRTGPTLEYSRITLLAASVSDALERACYSATYGSPWRPEDVDLQAVFDKDENVLWVDEDSYRIVQKKHEFRGMDRREFVARFGMTSAMIIFGLFPFRGNAGTTTTALSGAGTNFIPVGQQLFSSPGNHVFTVPTGVTSVCVVCIGGGGGSGGSYGSGGGGALGYKNNIAVTAGQTISVVVGAGGSYGGTLGGGASQFVGNVTAGGGGFWVYSGHTSGVGGTRTGGDGGGNGGNGAQSNGTNASGAGGAGGYAGAGGSGGSVGASGSSGAGGGGGGGQGDKTAAPVGYSGGGGGVGVFGQGTNGAGGVLGSGTGGGGGSGGGAGYAATYQTATSGGAYGGGGAGSASAGFGSGAGGIVRVLWGPGRSFPSNAT